MKTLRVTCDACNPSVINGRPCHEERCVGHFTLHSAQADYARFRVYTLDVLGNARDGFEVNDRSRGDCIDVKISQWGVDDVDVVKALKSVGYIAKRSRVLSWRIDGDTSVLNIDWRKTGEPVFQLERV